MCPAKTVEPIEMPFGGQTRAGRPPPKKKPRHRWCAYWRHLANTIERSVRGGDAAACQITLTTCFEL